MRKLTILILSALVIVGLAPAAHATSRYAVTISASATERTLGHSFSLSGSVSPNAKGKTVSIQRKYPGGSWKTIAHDTLSSHSKYSKTIKPTRAAVTSYRVVKPHSSSRGSGVSATKVVSVGRWRNLVDLPRSAHVAAEEGTATIRGIAYPNSIRLTAGGDVKYNTANLCTKLTAFVGMDDNAADGSSAAVFITTPSGSIFGGSVARYELPVFFNNLDDISDRNILEFVVGSIALGNTAVFGSPKVYCFS